MTLTLTPLRNTRARPALYAYIDQAWPADVPVEDIVAHAATLGYTVSVGYIQGLARRRKLTRTTVTGRVPDRMKKTPQSEFLRAHYGTDATPQWILDRANELGPRIRTIKALRRVAQKLGLRRPEGAKLTGLQAGWKTATGFAHADYRQLMDAAECVSRAHVEAWAAQHLPTALEAKNWGTRMARINAMRRMAGLPLFRLEKPVKVRRESKPPSPVKEKAPPRAPRADIPGVVNGYKLAGWTEILSWWRDHGGKGWPQIADVNELRKKHARLPYKPMPGKYAPAPSMKSAA